MEFKRYIDKLILLTPQFKNKLIGIENVEQLAKFLDELLVGATIDNDGLMTREDKLTLTMLESRPLLTLIDSFKNEFNDVVSVEFPDFKITNTGIRQVVIESNSVKYVAGSYMVSHVIPHDLNSMDLNITIRTKDIGDQYYRICYADIVFLDNNNIQVNFTRAEQPNIFISKM